MGNLHEMIMILFFINRCIEVKNIVRDRGRNE